MIIVSFPEAESITKGLLPCLMLLDAAGEGVRGDEGLHFFLLGL